MTDNYLRDSLRDLAPRVTVPEEVRRARSARRNRRDTATRAPAMEGWPWTSAASSATGRSAASPEKIPAFMEPSERR